MQGQGQGNMHRIILALAFVALTATGAVARGGHSYGGPISGRALIIMVVFCLPIAFVLAICVWLDRDKIK
jgi:hypothetical protein